MTTGPVLPWHGGTILAGRWLRRVEELESSTEGLVAAGGLGLVAAAAVAAFVSAWLWPRRGADGASEVGGG